MQTLSKFSILSALALSLRAVNAGESGYWKFCGDDFKDCGIAVSSHNGNCFQEHYATSIYPTESDGDLYFPLLVAYSDSECKNELGCNSVGHDGTELKIDFKKNQAFKYALGANSFRFIHSGAKPAKCPNDCYGSCTSKKRSRIEGPLVSTTDVAPVNVTAEEEDLAKRQGGKNYWFCDDENCKVNCGAKIEPLTAGCANNEHPRKSVWSKGGISAVLGGFDNNSCDGGPVTKFTITDGCNVLPSQHDSWQTLGVN